MHSPNLPVSDVDHADPRFQLTHRTRTTGNEIYGLRLLYEWDEQERTNEEDCRWGTNPAQPTLRLLKHQEDRRSRQATSEWFQERQHAVPSS